MDTWPEAGCRFFAGDKKKTAEVLKISIKKLYNRLREYGPKP